MLSTRRERFLRLCKEILFPIFCVACGQEGGWWCQGCRQEESLNFVKLCPLCAVPTGGGEPCMRCRGDSCLDRVMALFAYREDASIGKLIKAFKYHYARDMHHLWQQILAERILFLQEFLSGSTVIPVPLYPRRERERGYNQATLIAEILSQQVQVPLVTNKLRRIRATNQQATLSKDERHQNVAGAFEWQGGGPPLKILLVDDVYTTGATMQECARVLKAAGAEQVSGITLARD